MNEMNTPKIDRRKKYFLVLDTETANGLDDPLVHDLGFVVADRKGNIYERHSYIIYDIFVAHRDLMKTAYYAEKIPSYEVALKAKTRRLVQFSTAKKIVAEVMANYGITEVWAFNARFDRGSLNTTERWLTKSKYRYFFPYGTEICCIWAVACQTLCQQKAYFKFIQENELVTKGRVKTSAEVVYRFLHQEPGYQEEHTALEDAMIELEILVKCFRQHKSIDRTPRRFPTTEVNKNYKIWEETLIGMEV